MDEPEKRENEKENNDLRYICVVCHYSRKYSQMCFSDESIIQICKYCWEDLKRSYPDLVLNDLKKQQRQEEPSSMQVKKILRIIKIRELIHSRKCMNVLWIESLSFIFSTAIINPKISSVNQALKIAFTFLAIGTIQIIALIFFEMLSRIFLLSEADKIFRNIHTNFLSPNGKLNLIAARGIMNHLEGKKPEEENKAWFHILSL